MKKFSKIIESNGVKLYKVLAQLDIIVEASNDGEAGYLADLTFSKIKGVENYHILKFEESTDNSLMNESKVKIKEEIKGNDYQMVSGIIDILKKVKDVDNRMEIAKDMISQFKEENIKFDYDNFLDSIK